MFDVNRSELEYQERYKILLHLEYKYNLLYTFPVSAIRVTDQEGIDYHHNLNKVWGYEGSMLRINNYPYESTRSWSLRKVKDRHDTEFTITGFVEGKGKFEGGLGKFLGVDLDGREVEVPYPSVTIEARRQILDLFETHYIGKVATFEYFERTPSGAYRFPRFKTLRNYE